MNTCCSAFILLFAYLNRITDGGAEAAGYTIMTFYYSGEARDGLA
jgi:hypothetical protein